MKKVFLGALAMLTLASCSKDETTSVNRDGDEIAFGVVANKGTRATDVYCNNNLPGSFKVWAKYDNKTYIDGDEIKKTADNKWENQSGTRYWPNEGDVDFYAHVNAGDAFQWNLTAPTIRNFTVASEVENQVDLLYAVKIGQNKVANAGQVKLNFRHALSQIVFQAKNTNANLYVEISGVKVCKVASTNTFTYPTANTDNNIENHDGTTGSITYDGSWGTWDELTSGTSQYEVGFDAVPVNGNNTTISLTSTPDTGKEFSKKAMLLLPQKTTKWDVEATDAEGTPAEQTGSYFLVKCQIWNVAGDTVDKTNDVCLWGKDGAADIAIPVAFTWEQGKKYIYTFVFGKGNGGYDPDPDPEDPDPTPVLVPITFDVTVDDFVPVTEEELETGVPATSGN